MGALEPVLGIAISGDFRAYALRLLLWHEIVNDTVGGVPVLVSYWPLCNSDVVFERRLEGRVLEFGNTGRLRHFDMVMYDKESESWWQQFLGEALIGEFTGKRLKLLRDDAAARPYGRTPYVGMDSRALPRERFPYALPPGVASLARLVPGGAGGRGLDAGSLKPREAGRARRPGADLGAGPELDPRQARDRRGPHLGNVVVQRRTVTGLEDVAYDVSFAFAFAFSAFVPDGVPHRQ